MDLVAISGEVYSLREVLGSSDRPVRGVYLGRFPDSATGYPHRFAYFANLKTRKTIRIAQFADYLLMGDVMEVRYTRKKFPQRGAEERYIRKLLETKLV